MFVRYSYINLRFHTYNKIFINDLVDDVNSLNLGVTIDGHRIRILPYADDIVLLCETENKFTKDA